MMMIFVSCFLFFVSFTQDNKSVCLACALSLFVSVVVERAMGKSTFSPFCRFGTRVMCSVARNQSVKNKLTRKSSDESFTLAQASRIGRESVFNLMIYLGKINTQLEMRYWIIRNEFLLSFTAGRFFFPPSSSFFYYCYILLRCTSWRWRWKSEIESETQTINESNNNNKKFFRWKISSDYLTPRTESK